METHSKFTFKNILKTYSKLALYCAYLLKGINMYDHSIPIFYITLRKEYLHFQQQNKINHKLTLELSQAAVGPTSIFPSFLPYFS